jgi:hypothetical protein
MLCVVTGGRSLKRARLGCHLSKITGQSTRIPQKLAIRSCLAITGAGKHYLIGEYAVYMMAKGPAGPQKPAFRAPPGRSKP